MRTSRRSTAGRRGDPHFPAAHLVAVVALIGAPVAAQTSQPTSTVPIIELPESVRAELSRVEDFSPRFDYPGFYALLRHVKGMAGAPGGSAGAEEISDWGALFDRPSDFRGRAITIEGMLGRSSAWRPTGAETADIGQVWQWELQRPDQPLACTVILTEEVGDVPLGAKVRVTGYFAMVRQYYGRQGRPLPALLFVAQAPTSVSRSTAVPRTESVGGWGIGGVCAALLAGVVAWRVLRRRETTRTDLRGLRPERAAPLNLSAEIAEWSGAPSAAPPEREEPRC